MLIAISAVVVVALVVGGIVISVAHSNSDSTASSTPHLVVPGTSPAPSSQPAPGGSTAPIPNASSAPGGPSASGVTTGPLDSYLLSPSEASATGMDLIDGGRSITPDNATLDWCGRSYPSDQLRSARVQVEYDGSDLFVSNEFVKYKSGGTAQAYTEIQAAVQACQPSFQESGQTTDQIEVAAHSPALVTDQVTVSAFEAGEVPLWTAVVYQFDGNYFSGVYVSGGTRASVLLGVQKLAASAATHLREAVAGKTGSGGGVVGTEPPASSAPAGGGVQT